MGELEAPNSTRKLNTFSNGVYFHSLDDSFTSSMSMIRDDPLQLYISRLSVSGERECGKVLVAGGFLEQVVGDWST